MKKMELQYLPLSVIDISFSNVRRENLKEGIGDLARSIDEIGVQQPIVVVRKPDGRYDLIIGQRRYLACQDLGLKEIPALITSVKDKTDAIIKSFSENIHRLDLDYRDKMQVALELLQRFGTREKVAEHLGVSPQTVKNWLGYAAVPEPIKKMVDDGKLSASTATRITKNIPDEKLAIKIAVQIKETPRSKERRNIIDVARENPNRPAEEIVRLARERTRMKSITIHVTQRVYSAIVRASQKYESDKEEVVKEAIEDWLKNKGLLNEEF